MAKKKRNVPEVNSSSSADIAFLLLIFFLITSSMDSDKGIARRLPPPVPKDQADLAVDIKERNVMQILVNLEDRVAVNGEEIAVSQLRNKVKEFIVNANDDAHLPEVFMLEVPYFGQYPVTKNHVVSLLNDMGTTYEAYIEVQNEIVAAYNELRNDLSKKKFGKTFDELSVEQQDAVKMIYPQQISESEPKKYGGKK
jgi:biopolymer transport protein ExbD